MKKIIVLEGCSREYLENFTKQIREMKVDDSLITSSDIKIYNIDDAVALTNKEVKDFIKKHSINK